MSRNKLWNSVHSLVLLPAHWYVWMCLCMCSSVRVRACICVCVCGMIISVLEYAEEKDFIDTHQKQLTLGSGFGKAVCGREILLSLYPSVLSDYFISM